VWSAQQVPMAVNLGFLDCVYIYIHIKFIKKQAATVLSHNTALQVMDIEVHIINTIFSDIFIMIQPIK
jgi:hypothetical protein